MEKDDKGVVWSGRTRRPQVISMSSGDFCGKHGEGSKGSGKGEPLHQTQKVKKEKGRNWGGLRRPRNIQINRGTGKGENPLIREHKKKRRSKERIDLKISRGSARTVEK